MIFGGQDIGIDLGTATILVYVKGKGIVLREPSVVAIDKNTNQVLAVGQEARKMLGRTPGNIVALRPLKDGVISDYTITEKMLEYFINKVCGKFVFAPKIMICVPSRVTEVERKAVIDAASHAGARKVYLIEEPIAAAIGAGIDISKPSLHKLETGKRILKDYELLGLSYVFKVPIEELLDDFISELKNQDVV